MDGRTEPLLTPQDLLDRLARLVTPPRRHKHRYCGVLAPNANLRQAVTASAGPAGSTLQVLEEARRRMALPAAAADPDPPPDERRSALSRAASRCWALLLARIFECLPLACPRCGEPMRIIAFVLDPPVIERILRHIGEPVVAPPVLPARSPPQGDLGFDQTAPGAPWPEMDQTVGAADGGFGGGLRRARRSDGQAACRPVAWGSTIRGIQVGWAGVVGANRRLECLSAGW